MINSFNYLLLIIMIMISVAFYTILERKILSYIQIRKGPNKVGFMGILQPFSDAIKLFNKKMMYMENSNFILFSILPLLILLINLLMWPFLLFSYPLVDSNFSIIVIMILSSLAVLILLSMSWASNSKYSHLGAIRNIAQMISYEISLFFIILIMFLPCFNYNFINLKMIQMFTFLMLGNSLIFLIWNVSMLAEVNRSPFDFVEGESELVSGFNVEFMGGWFTFIFLAEYASMLLMSMLTSMLFFNMNLITLMIFTISQCLILLWIRGTYPRFRYDLIMKLNWIMILPVLTFLIPFSFNFFMNF